jgi:nitroreductase
MLIFAHYLKTNQEVSMNYESFLELVKKRRSNRSLKSDPVPDEYVDKIIEAARWAPSGANTQPWEFFVIRKQELKDGIVKAVEEARAKVPGYLATESTGVPPTRQAKRMDIRKAPVFIMLLGDNRLKIGSPAGTIFEDSKWNSILTSSLASAFLYLHLAATSLGLGSQWYSAVSSPAAERGIKQILEIPEEYTIYDMMVVGYPEDEPGPKFMRERKEMVHYEYYGKGGSIRTDEDVKDFLIRSRS